jgi:recombination protein RecA
VEFDILFDSGIDSLSSLLEAAEASGVVTRRGAYFFLGEARLGQGREGCMQVRAAAGGCM